MASKCDEGDVRALLKYMVEREEEARKANEKARRAIVCPS